MRAARATPGWSCCRAQRTTSRRESGCFLTPARPSGLGPLGYALARAWRYGHTSAVRRRTRVMIHAARLGHRAEQGKGPTQVKSWVCFPSHFDPWSVYTEGNSLPSYLVDL
jgi:hypothetical protein